MRSSELLDLVWVPQHGHCFRLKVPSLLPSRSAPSRCPEAELTRLTHAWTDCPGGSLPLEFSFSQVLSTILIILCNTFPRRQGSCHFKAMPILCNLGQLSNFLGHAHR